jgi:hypothetical protein
VSEQARPWWASEGPVEGGISPDEDPVERFRSARRGPEAASRGEADAEPWIEAAAATMSRLARDFAEGAQGGSQVPPREPTHASGGAASNGDAAGGTTGAGSTQAGSQEGGSGEAGPREAGPREAGPREAGSSGPPPHSPDVCGVCPICIGLRTLAEARPELMGHLAEAARHVALAARSLMERPERPEGGGGGEPLEHIDLD